MRIFNIIFALRLPPVLGLVMAISFLGLSAELQAETMVRELTVANDGVEQAHLDDSQKGAKKPVIVVSIKPLKLIVDALFDNTVITHQLIPSGVTPHDFQLKFSHMQQLQEADFVLWLGKEAEPYFESVLTRYKASTIAVTEIPEIKKLPLRHLATEEVHDEVGGNLEAHAEKHHQIDIHFWLDLENQRRIANALAKLMLSKGQLTERVYDERLNSFSQRLDSINAEILDAKAIWSKPPAILVFHDAFQYWERQLSVDAVATVVNDHGAGISVKHLLDLRKQIQDHHISCVWASPGSNLKLLKKIFGDNHYRIASLDLLASSDALDNLQQYWMNLLQESTRCLKEQTDLKE